MIQISKTNNWKTITTNYQRIACMANCRLALHLLKRLTAWVLPTVATWCTSQDQLCHRKAELVSGLPHQSSP